MGSERCARAVALSVQSLSRTVSASVAQRTKSVCEYIYECVDTTGAVPRACREREAYLRWHKGQRVASEGSERKQSKKQSVTDASSEDSRREKIEKIERKEWGQ
jgi:hypothetical protein